MEWLLIIVLFIFSISYIVHLSNKARRKRLMLKYNNDIELVERLMRREFWQGQTTQYLLDSLGTPNDIGRQVLKTKIKETWKYQKTGNNRYALKIFIEDGIVIGWDQK